MTKKYFTLVLDHNGSKAFEMGGGICGSGFPEYDFSHLDELVDEGEQPAKEASMAKSPMRRKIIAQLAAHVKKLYIVNGNMGMLFETLGEQFIAKFSNIQYFPTFLAFCEFAINHPEALEGAALIVDKLSMGNAITEEDYAAILQQKGIDIPVVNAGAYKIYDDKFMFPSLFTGPASNMIPKTWLVNKNNYMDMLNQIQETSIDQFILKLPISSHARDTIIVDKAQLKKLVLSLILKNNPKLSDLGLDGTDPNCFEYFVKNLSPQDRSFVIRELVMADPIKLGAESYRCAARSVMIACFDTEKQQFDFIESVADYWQRAKKPYRAGERIDHGNMISTDIETVDTKSTIGRSGIFIGRNQFQQITQEFSVDTDWTEEQYKQYFPQVIEIARHILATIANIDFTTELLRLTESNQNSIAKLHLISRVCSNPINCYNEQLVMRLSSLVSDPEQFVVMQLEGVLMGLRYYCDCSLLPRPIFVAFNQVFAKNPHGVGEFIDTMVRMIMSHDVETRNKLKLITHSYAPIFSASVMSIEMTAEKMLKQANKHHQAALLAYQNKNYGQALTAWQAALRLQLVAAPFSPEIVSTYSNIGTCYRELGDYEQAADAYCKGTVICKSSNQWQGLERLTNKLSIIKKIREERALGASVSSTSACP